MSHELESGFSTKLQAWHGLMNVLDNYPTSEEAIKAAGLDWPVERRPIYWGKDIGTAYQPEEIKNRRAIVRVRKVPFTDQNGEGTRTEDDLLSVVSDGYQPLQNTEAFSFFDELVKSGDIVYETAGSLFEGRKIWVLARYLKKQIKIMGTDEVRPYLLLLNGHDGVTGVSVQPTGVRVVCNNTLMASLAQGHTINFKHVGDVRGEIEKAKVVLEEMRLTFDEMAETYSHMAEIHLDQDAIDEMIRKVCCPGDWKSEVTGQPDEEMILVQGEIMPTKAKRLTAMEAKVRSLLRNGQGASADTYGTLWGTYNALVEFADYFLGRKSKDRAGYQLIGEGGRFKQLALDVSKEIIEERLKTPPEKPAFEVPLNGCQDPDFATVGEKTMDLSPIPKS